MDAAPEDSVAAMSMRAAANQFGYLWAPPRAGWHSASAAFPRSASRSPRCTRARRSSTPPPTSAHRVPSRREATHEPPPVAGSPPCGACACAIRWLCAAALVAILLAAPAGAAPLGEIDVGDNNRFVLVGERILMWQEEGDLLSVSERDERSGSSLSSTAARAGASGSHARARAPIAARALHG